MRKGKPAQYVIAACPEGVFLKSLPKAIQPKRHAALLSHLSSLEPIKTLLYSLPTNSPSQSGLTFVFNVSAT